MSNDNPAAAIALVVKIRNKIQQALAPGLIYRAESNASPLAAVQTGRPARMGGRT